MTRDGLVFDFGTDREMSGLGLQWPAGPTHPRDFAVERS